jgi:hypothetical protein
MEQLSFWSVERDRDAIVAMCPEPLRYASDDRPEWMARCASALRDELKLLAVEPGTLLEATLIGVRSQDADLAGVLLYNVGVPAVQVDAGVRLRRLAPSDSRGAVQRYRRVPVAVAGGEDDGAMLARVLVPVADGREIDNAREVWLAARRAVVAGLPVAAEAPPGGIDLRVRVVVGADPRRGSADLVKKLLDGVIASFQVYNGANVEEVVRRLSLELGEDPERLRELALSTRGALLGANDSFWLRQAGVQLSPAGDRMHAAEVVFVSGAVAQLEIELRAIAAA